MTVKGSSARDRLLVVVESACLPCAHRGAGHRRNFGSGHLAARVEFFLSVGFSESTRPLAAKQFLFELNVGGTIKARTRDMTVDHALLAILQLETISVLFDEASGNPDFIDRPRTHFDGFTEACAATRSGERGNARHGVRRFAEIFFALGQVAVGGLPCGTARLNRAAAYVDRVA